MRALFAMRSDLPPRLFDDAALEKLRAAVGIDTSRVVVNFEDLSDDESAEVEVLITGWDAPRIGRRELERFPSLALVTHAGGTVRGMLDRAVWDRGVTVTTAADANAVPVAEFALAMILLAGKDAPWLERDYAVRPRAIDLVAERPDIGNFGRVVGLIGASNVGRRVAKLLAPFDLDVRMWSPDLSAADAAALGVRAMPLRELIATSSVVSLHAPLLPQTINMIAARQLASMSDGATLINTARAGLVDQDALAVETASGRLRAILDVTAPDALPADHALRARPSVYITPHLAGSQGNELHRLGRAVVNEVLRYSDGKSPQFPVALEEYERRA